MTDGLNRLDALRRLGVDEGMARAFGDVIDERHRQIAVEGFDADHDDQSRAGQLAEAGAAYAAWAGYQADRMVTPDQDTRKAALRLWPWAQKWWKPKDARHNLVRAAALIIAEIERLDRRPIAGS